jgi:hypothetical protein
LAGPLVRGFRLAICAFTRHRREQNNCCCPPRRRGSNPSPHSAHARCGHNVGSRAAEDGSAGEPPDPSSRPGAPAPHPGDAPGCPAEAAQAMSPGSGGRVRPGDASTRAVSPGSGRNGTARTSCRCASAASACRTASSRSAIATCCTSSARRSSENIVIYFHGKAKY